MSDRTCSSKCVLSQVFDLTRLDGVAGPVVFTEDAHYADIGGCHNVISNEETGYIYAVGCITGNYTKCRGITLVLHNLLNSFLTYINWYGLDKVSISFLVRFVLQFKLLANINSKVTTPLG